MLPPVGNICQAISLAASKSHKTSSKHILLAPQNEKVCRPKSYVVVTFFLPQPPRRFTQSKSKTSQRPICHRISIPQDMIVALPWPADRKLKSRIRKASFFLDGFGGITFSMQGTLVKKTVAVCNLYVGDEVVLPSYQKGIVIKD